ncbi:glycosyltransferase family 2 [Haloferula helveola]|uniref:Glycosyltransferase family 2 n=1 Tax=Haloferula helveola TaxID=490095 RepID=A0ABM7R8Y1_9BACT|nr:glycosyltransferase family 2 [Haloferula helveola]
MRLSVIVAAFNEEHAIGSTLADLHAHLPAETEILVVDGGKDRTGEVVEGWTDRLPGLRYIPHPNDRGKGHAIRTGIREATGDLHAQFDADGQFFAKDLLPLVEPLERGELDVVLGTRFATGSGRDADAAWSRSLGNRVVSGWASLLFGQRMTDVLAGIKAWTRASASAIDLRSDTYEYEVEIPCRAIRAGLRVGEVPVDTRAREEGESKVPVLRTGIRVLTATTRFRWQS